ncbi:MAG: adenylate/guanylate cyclase domain-containing protein [Hyphomicrobium sp.]
MEQPHQPRPAISLRSLTRRAIERFKNYFSGLANYGIATYPPDTRRRLKILNVISALVATTTLIYAIQLAASGDPALTPVVIINVLLAGIALIVPLMHRFNDIAGALLLISAELVALVGFAWFFGKAGGAPLQYAVFAAAPFVVFDVPRFRIALAVVASALVLHFIAWFSFPQPGSLNVTPDMTNSLYIQGGMTTFGLIAASVYYAFSLAERAKAETESVLRNVLPESVVERLKARPDETIADAFPHASVLFADISGFVGLARSLGPEKTVALLNQLVSAFDVLAQRHGVEKIKTIGDAYMVASGVPEPRPDHVAALGAMALDMLSTTKKTSAETGLALSLRIGMASGPMMAGVIGSKKFSYDVWGDPVNLASRLEGLSAPGRILVCPTSRDELEKEFILESRGAIEIKGLGAQEAWYLVAKRDP